MGQGLRAMHDWVNTVRLALQVEGPCDVDLILDTTKDVAHHVERAAAPVTAYLLGYAVGRGADPQEASELVRELALGWREQK